MAAVSRRSKTFVVVVMGGLLGLLACGSESPEATAPVEPAAQARDAPQAVPRGPAAPESAVMAELAETMPADLPVLPGLGLKHLAQSHDGAQSVVMEASGAVADVASEYAELLEDEGWMVVRKQEQEGWSLVARKEGGMAIAHLVPGGPGTLITLVVAELE